VSSARLTLVHSAVPATVETFAGGASLGMQTMTAAAGSPETLSISGVAIDRIVVTPPSNETLLLELCLA
jgi:hypothetical protein